MYNSTKYNWLEQQQSEKVIKHLELENLNVSTNLDGENTAKIKDQLISLLTNVEEHPHVQHREMYYYKQMIADVYPKLYNSRKCILDPNVFEYEYAKVGSISIHKSNNKLIYTLDKTGSEEYGCYIKHLDTNKQTLLYQNVCEDVYWMDDDIVYTRMDDSLRENKVYINDNLIYTEKNDTYSISTSVSKLNKVMISSGTHTTNKVFVYVDKQLIQLTPEEVNIEYHIVDGGYEYVGITNKNACNFKLIRLNTDLEDIIEYDPTKFLTDVDIFKSIIILLGYHSAENCAWVVNRDDQQVFQLKFRMSLPDIYMKYNFTYDTTDIRFYCSNPTTPTTTIIYNIKTQTLENVHQKNINGYDASKYKFERVWVPSTDQYTKIPVTIISTKTKTTKTMIYGYGAYGSMTTTHFRTDILPLLDSGIAYVLAHVRGGGEMGYQWYMDGKMSNKIKTFEDFIDCTLYLQDQGYCTPLTTYIQGRSAGGLLVGAVLNMRPDLYDSAITEVPFVDVVRTMSDPSIPLTTLEYGEWGNPNVLSELKYMNRYDPMQNIKNTKYPRVFVSCGLNDSRVKYWEAAKWVGYLRSETKYAHILLYTNMNSGHFDASNRFKKIELLAREYRFLKI